MVTVEYNKDLSAMNTFGMKVSCACFVEYDSAEDLKKIFGERIHTLPQPVFHIGGGSNLLFTKDFPGTVFHSRIKFIAPIDFCETSNVFSDKELFNKPSSDGATGSGLCLQSRKDEKVAGQSLIDRNPPRGCRGVLVEAGSGVVFDDLCAWAAEQGLWGLENLSLIPGEVGAAAVQNIGAYGVEIKDIISKVNCFDVITGTVVTFDVKDCRYAYRDSIFKDTAKGRYIVISVVFRLSMEKSPRLDYGHVRAAVKETLGCNVEKAGDKLTPAFVRNIITGIRETKLPDPAKTGSAGSFFKNPVVPRSTYDKVLKIARFEHGADYNVPHYDTWSGFVKIPAAWLIEQCGWKGHVEGNAGVYEKQPLVLVNLTGQATPEEIIGLEQKIISSVKEKFEIELHPEVEHI